MKLSDLGENKVVQRLLARLGPCEARRVVLGPGDDCAVVKRGKVLELLKTDCVVEGIHFLRNQPAQWIGWKALCRNISDVAAMGGIPKEALITVAAPADLDLRFLEDCFTGIRKAARKYDVAVVGGETSRSPGPIFISVALTGEVESRNLVKRSGGRAGDLLLVTGTLGGSIHGKHLKFEPRVAEARWLASHFPLHAMMDLSDGLGQDLPRLAEASGCGFALAMDAIPISRAAKGIQEAISDGEDYELLFAVSPATAKKILKQWAFDLPLTVIGQLTRRSTKTKLSHGHDHFA